MTALGFGVLTSYPSIKVAPSNTNIFSSVVFDNSNDDLLYTVAESLLVKLL